MQQVSTLRLNLLRAMYLLIAVGLGFQIWPGILDPPRDLEHMSGVVSALLAGLSLLALLGLRYPVTMMPLLLFELAWKCIWILSIGLPLWSSDRLDAGTEETLYSCLMGVVLVPLVIPWSYVRARLLFAPGDLWTTRPR